ncbi:PleD family two-component system response regulator [Candidatus Latescibacterota bacterium]
MAYILMIDDNPQSQRYIGKILRHRSNHEIEFAATSYGAVEKLVERRPDLIFLDLFIPGADGLEFYQSLRAHPATKSIPIVIHTAVPLDQITKLRLRQVKRRVRYDGFVEFPIDASELNRIIDSALKRGSQNVQKWTPPSV